MLLSRLACRFHAIYQVAGFRVSPGVCSLNTSPRALDLRDFLDQTIKDGKPAPTGADWKAKELSLKSWDDLHKLWHVLLKERLMLKSEQLRYKALGQLMPNPRRITKVRKSMNRIKQVLSQRAHAHEDPIKKKQLLQMINAI